MTRVASAARNRRGLAQTRPIARSIAEPIRVALHAALLLAAPIVLMAVPIATADSTEPSLSDAKWAFEQHARSWMAGLEKGEARNRSEAPVYTVANEVVIRFDGYGDDFETQVKATGQAKTPYVGILRYKENIYTCLRENSNRCTVTRSVPVSEIFSYRNGRWAY